MNTEFSNIKAGCFSLAKPSGVTIAEYLSNERQGELFISGINQAVEDFNRLKGFIGQDAQQSYLPVFWERKEDLFAGSGWLDLRVALEVLSKRYLFDLLDSWVCEVEVNDLIARIRQSSEIINAAQVALRLDQLRKISDEEKPDGCTISSDSLRSFVKFVYLYPRLRYPDITLTPSGNVYARWKGSHKFLISIQFLPKLKVRFVLFAPNPRHPEELNRASGTDFVDTVIDNLSRAYGVSDWILE